jgi:hypothetical protein
MGVTLLSHLPAAPLNTATTGRKLVAERPATSHTYPIRSLPQGQNNDEQHHDQNMEFKIISKYTPMNSELK